MEVVIIRKRKLLLHFSAADCCAGVGSSSMGSIINAQPAFYFNLDLTVSLLVLSGHFDSACHRYCVLFTRWQDALAFEGSSHCLGWPVLLYRKRPRASLNCILVDETARLYIGAATSAPPMQNDTEVRKDRVEKVKLLSHPCFDIRPFSGAGGSHGVPLGLL